MGMDTAVLYVAIQPATLKYMTALSGTESLKTLILNRQTL